MDQKRGINHVPTTHPNKPVGKTRMARNLMPLGKQTARRP
jgi:hypothetical protein